jgi:hypothetical protein
MSREPRKKPLGRSRQHAPVPLAELRRNITESIKESVRRKRDRARKSALVAVVAPEISAVLFDRPMSDGEMLDTFGAVLVSSRKASSSLPRYFDVTVLTVEEWEQSEFRHEQET